jgi:hypothetical protein
MILAEHTHEADRIIVQDGIAWKYLRDLGAYAGVTPEQREHQLRLRVSESQFWPELNPLHYDEERHCFVSPYIAGRLPTRPEVRHIVRKTRYTGRGYLTDIAAANIVVHSSGQAVVIDFVVDTAKPDFISTPCWGAVFGPSESCRRESCCYCDPQRGGLPASEEDLPGDPAILLIARTADEAQRCLFFANALRDSGTNHFVQIWCRRHALNWATVNRHCWDSNIRFANMDVAAYRLPADQRTDDQVLAFALRRLPFDSVIVVAGVDSASLTTVESLLKRRQSFGGATIVRSPRTPRQMNAAPTDFISTLLEISDGRDVLFRLDRWHAPCESPTPATAQ